jgi:hypothetical protein
MTDDRSEALDDQVRSLFETIAAGYRPAVDLVPAAVAGARRGSRRRYFTIGLSTGLVAAAVAAVAFIAPSSTPGAGTAPGASDAPGTNPACVGVWLPWTDQSDAGMFGKGTDAQRSAVCTEDLAGIKSLIPGVSITPVWETFGDGSRGEFTPDQIAKMGSGLDPKTHVLKPWQYDVTVSGHKAYFYISYSTTGTDICTSCGRSAPVNLPGGFAILGGGESPSQPMPEVLVGTPAHTYLGIGLSPNAGGAFTQPFSLIRLLQDPRFIDVLAADLHELYH